MNKEAAASVEIHDLIKKRWSPRAFSSKPVETEKLQRLFEAARWSASCFNEQPWRFILGLKDRGQAYKKIFETLAEGNKIWCRNVPVLVLLIAKKTFSHNGKANLWHQYDLGQAAAYLSLQATAEGLYVHQMAGFNPSKARELFSIPDDFEPFTVMAIGYLGQPDQLPDDLKEMETAARTRMQSNKFVFSEIWGKEFNWTDSEKK